ncbi:MAG: D-arabinose 5-phosphate isomerase [Bacteroidetes bacterium]|nr:MAG: D-arabinose 5-phosphate isomerase [Bacteroidota bacterium]RLD87200.1 MAG: D-arabinose 5-phosphate isomerase [Bacteroidota bacterium]
MNRIDKIQKVARETIETEYRAIKNLGESINEEFAGAVDVLFNMKGRVVVTGIGKSANIAQKIVATFNSTGTPSIFMHAADAIHGDLGIIRKDDVVVILSKSGETPEIKVLVPLLKGRCDHLIAIVGNNESYLAKLADFVLDVTVEKEACPNNLAPTASTTAQLVMGDALAISLLDLRGFSPTDFAKFHPGGALGKRMFLRVNELAVNNMAPKVHVDELISDVIIEISSKRLGATAVLDNNDHLVGVITDGDLRRMIQSHPNYQKLTAKEVMTHNPKTIQKDELVVDALHLMREKNITQLPVLDKDEYIGVIHLHDILKEGIL